MRFAARFLYSLVPPFITLVSLSSFQHCINNPYQNYSAIDIKMRKFFLSITVNILKQIDSILFFSQIMTVYAQNHAFRAGAIDIGSNLK